MLTVNLSWSGDGDIHRILLLAEGLRIYQPRVFVFQTTDGYISRFDKCSALDNCAYLNK